MPEAGQVMSNTEMTRQHSNAPETCDLKIGMTTSAAKAIRRIGRSSKAIRGDSA